MDYKGISADKAIKLVSSGGEVYMIQRIAPETTIKQINLAEGFIIKDSGENSEPAKEETRNPKAVPKRVDHGKIVALYTANPPRTVSWIADEVGCSIPTVISHLEKEGIYKKRGEAEDGSIGNIED